MSLAELGKGDSLSEEALVSDATLTDGILMRLSKKDFPAHRSTAPA